MYPDLSRTALYCICVQNSIIQKLVITMACQHGSSNLLLCIGLDLSFVDPNIVIQYTTIPDYEISDQQKYSKSVFRALGSSCFVHSWLHVFTIKKCTDTDTYIIYILKQFHHFESFPTGPMRASRIRLAADSTPVSSIKRRKWPPGCFTSSLGVSNSATQPASSTRMRSERITVDKRWAMTNTVEERKASCGVRESERRSRSARVWVSGWICVSNWESEWAD